MPALIAYYSRTDENYFGGTLRYIDKGNTQIAAEILQALTGSGWYVEEGKAPRSLEPGDVVVIPPNVKHWHGAKKDSWFSHIAVEVPGDNTSNEWCEPVTDEEYNNL